MQFTLSWLELVAVLLAGGASSVSVGPSILRAAPITPRPSRTQATTGPDERKTQTRS